MNDGTIWWGFLFGSIGAGFALYGRKQRALVPLACGLGLMFFPYFVTNTILIVAIGVALMAIPWFMRDRS